MNDEQFERAMRYFEGIDERLLAGDLRARDTAQREALARVEAERYIARQQVLDVVERCGDDMGYLRAQLAEAVGLGKSLHSACVNLLYGGYDRITELGGDCDSVSKMEAENPSMQEWKSFLARHAQAEHRDGPEFGDGPEFEGWAERSGIAQAEQQGISDAELMDVAMFAGSGNKAARRANALGAAELPEHLAPQQQEAQPTCQHLEALKRFHETCGDGEAYDVPVETMHQLAAMGLIDPAPEHGEHGFSMNAKGYAALSPRQEAQGAQAGEFQREDRYLVIKRKDLGLLSPTDRDLALTLMEELRAVMATWNVPERQYLVIEGDWPEYEPTWAAIQARVAGRTALATQPAALPTDPASWPLKVGADEFIRQQADWPDTDPADFMHDALYEMIRVLTRPAVRGAEHE